MATFRWFDGNQGNYGYQNFDKFDITKITSKAITAEYNGNNGPQDDALQPARLKVVIKDAVALNPGADPGDRRFSEGTITKITWFNSSGDKVLEASGLDVSLPVASAMTASGNGYLLDDLIWSGGHRFVGSDDSMGPDWDGDDIKTGSGDDTVNGNDGGDFISDQGGADIYNGGAGRDTINYSDSFYNIHLANQGIRADLKAGTIVGTDGLTDQVSGIEQIRGSFMRDVMKGDGNDNRFTGLQGNDVFDGRGGFDTIRYDRDNRQGGFEGVTVDLGKGTATDGFGNKDTFKNIEGVRGTDYDDVLKDSAGNNWLSGRGGDDVICVSGGNDDVEGGGGDDVFQFKGKSFGDNTIRDFEDGTDMIEILHAKRFKQLTIEDTGSGDALISYRDSSITVEDVSADDLGKADFIF
jgi:Ca2+-binding RTX toxin-like protein